jgi:glycyl-tRNA synthetase alpha chain
LINMPLSYQDLLFELQKYWSEQGCVIQQPYDLEVGAGTMCPETFLRVLGPDPYRVAYVQPSRRPNDGRYGENPNRLYKHMQLQVILKPAPANVQDLYLNSLEHIGISLAKHDIKFEEDNWEAPTLGAWGVGWQVMLDGLEISQFTYFQQCGGIDLDPVTVELTYGLERLCAFIQDVDSVYDIQWNPAVAGAKVYSYRDIRWRDERDFSVYNFEQADVDSLWELFKRHEAEAKRLTTLADPPLLAAHEQVLKCSHLFNLLDARGAISVTERVGMIARVRDLAVGVAAKWVAPKEEEVPA